MRRIRLVFLALAVALLIPIGLLVRSALENAAAQREVRHRALAERVFDEMERALSQLLQVEDARPFGHYRFYYVQPQVVRGRYTVARSPLSWPPLESYVVGYFQVDPDLSFHSPLIPQDRAAAAAAGDFAATPDLVRSVADVKRIVQRGLATGAVLARSLVQPPGTTQRLRRRLSLDLPAPAAGERDAAEAPPGGLDGTYAALRELNRGIESRARRTHKQLDVLSPFGEVPAEAEALAFADAAGPAYVEPDLFLDPDAVLAGEVPHPSFAQTRPMIGYVADGRYLLLHRLALVDGREYRQGLVLNVRALTDWLDASVFRGSELEDRAGRNFFLHAVGAPLHPEEAEFAYVHRFAEPFDDLAVRLSLDPTTDAGFAYVYALAVLLLAAGAGGLYALYRMVAVTVRFAERRSNFAAAVTHELKTPVTAIRMYGEMLRDGMVDSPERQKEYLSTITAETERLTRLIDNVLEFSRLEQGTREIATSVGALSPVVEGAVRMLTPHARNAGFEVRLEIEPALPAVRFDRDAVVQLIFNLVDNAIKYARDARERVVVVRCARTESGVELAVRDYGPGVAPGHLSRIFEAFYRGESELTRTAKGTGIGLALVKGLAERMGAVLDARNAAGGGLEVALRFRSEAA